MGITMVIAWNNTHKLGQNPEHGFCWVKTKLAKKIINQKKDVEPPAAIGAVFFSKTWCCRYFAWETQ
jgi:hypothetical protein